MIHMIHMPNTDAKVAVFGILHVVDRQLSISKFHYRRVEK